MKQLRQLSMCSLLLFAACSKSKTEPTTSNTTTNNPTTNKVVDEAKLKTRWQATSAYTLHYDGSGNVKQGYGYSQSYHDNSIIWLDTLTTYITFNPDNSFDHTQKNGTPGGLIYSSIVPSHGKWQLKNGNQTIALTLKGAGNKDTLVDFQVVEFKDNYMHVTYSDSMFANKEKEITHYEFSH